MSETLQTANDAENQEQLTSRQTAAHTAKPIPWERDEKWLRTFFSTWWQVIHRPYPTLSHLPREGKLSRPFIFVLIVHCLSTFITMLVGIPYVYELIGPADIPPVEDFFIFAFVAFRQIFEKFVFWLIGFIVLIFTTQLLAKVFIRSAIPLKTLFRTFAYSFAPYLSFVIFDLIFIPIIYGSSDPNRILVKLYAFSSSAMKFTVMVYFSTALNVLSKCGKLKAFALMIIPMILLLLVIESRIFLYPF